ncbi:MAG: hypothetical protein RCG15_04350 [Candidatus Rickettsia vulgarisii]
MQTLNSLLKYIINSTIKYLVKNLLITSNITTVIIAINNAYGSGTFTNPSNNLLIDAGFNSNFYEGLFTTKEISAQDYLARLHNAKSSRL